MAILKNTTISDTGNLTLPVGATGDRPGSLIAGQLRYNSTLGHVETYTTGSNIWQTPAARSVRATGGTRTYDTSVNGTIYRVHAFTTTGSDTFTVTQPGTVEYMIVGGGGGGSGNFYDDGAGGGAGGVVMGTTTVTSQAYTVIVGSGGDAGFGGNNGGNSAAFGLTGIGGGGGSGHRGQGSAGGSGGGGGGSFSGDGYNNYGGAAQQPGSASGGFGNAGGQGGYDGVTQNGGYPASGGGGGAGALGGSPRSATGALGGWGGIGIRSDISGITTWYAGGGGGVQVGVGGLGGGATASTGRGGVVARPATANTGGGGGGGRREDVPFTNSPGGNGVVIIRYPLQSTPDVVAATYTESGLLLDLDFAKPMVYVGTGTTVNDSRLTANSGVLVNAPTTRDYRTHRSSLNYNGSTQHIRFDSFGDKPTGTGMTCEAWVFPRRAVTTGTLRGAIWSSTSSTYLGIFDSNDGGTNHGLHWALQTVGQRTGGNNGSIPRNNWSHIIGTYDGSRTKGYVNGVLVYDVAQTGNITDGTWYLGVYGQGINDTTHNFEGEIALATIYNRALSQTEITNNFDATRWRFGV